MVDRRLRVLGVLAVTLALAAPASASGAVTIGSNLGANPNVASGNCGGDCTFTQQDLPTIVTAPSGLRAPSDGVVVRWRIQIGSKTTPVTLRIVRQPKVLISGMTGAGTGCAVPAPPVNQISTFDARPPIGVGDRVGIDGGNGSVLAAFTQISNAHAAQWLPPLVDGEPARSPFTHSDTDLLVNADIEPDCDTDGFGDQTQDGDLSTCGPAATTPPGATPPGTTPAGQAPTLPSGAPATCKGTPATILGTEGDDVRIGSQGPDVIVGLGGNDTLSGIAGNDLICGGAGKDKLKGGPLNDGLLGQKGNDKLKGGGGNDLCKGGKGKDSASKCEVEKSI